jgi:1-deoxyxylulose-5-phosphate synthase
MQYRQLGRSGILVSPICLGTMNLGGPTPVDESIRLINRALAAGINFIDTANSYNDGESERVVGKALKENGKRDQIVLATKVHSRVGSGPNEADLSRYHIVKACEDSLRRLQTDHVDLYQAHRPSERVPQEEWLRALEDLVQAGKVLHIGCSNFAAWQLMEGLAISDKRGWSPYVSVQPPYNIVDRRIENELVPLCQKYDVGIIPWSPLAMGMAAGKYLPGAAAPDDSRLAKGQNMMNVRVTNRAREVGAAIVEIAKDRGITPGQLGLLWVKDQPGITAPIIGPRTMAHLEDAIPVLDMTLADADRPRFDALVHPGNAVSDFHNSSWWMKARVEDR